MCSCNSRSSDIPPWLRSLHASARRHRNDLLAVVALGVTVAALAGLLFYFFGPTDIDRAEADLKKAWAVLNALEEETAQARNDARGHTKRAAEYREVAEADKANTTPDAARAEWIAASADAHAQLSKANWERRDNGLHLAAEYRRLIAEADCEILRAKNARDRGTPYKVAPRVRNLLAPLLAAR
jgi:hypothetical protein